jgi:hypothetical protein
MCDKCEDYQNIFMKIREGKYVYCFDEPGHIYISNPETEEELFSGQISEFMDMVGDHLSLLEDPMSTTQKPLWEQI